MKTLALCYGFALTMMAGPVLAANPANDTAASRDPLFWLGPLPPALTSADAANAYEQAMIDAMAMPPMPPESHVLNRHCALPLPGSLVRTSAVVKQFIDEYDAGMRGGVQLDDLFGAAAQGDWSARSWVFQYLYEQTPVTPEARYRMAQLVRLMHLEQIGPLYVFLAAGRSYQYSQRYTQADQGPWALRWLCHDAKPRSASILP